jgi:hypothetical protein
MNVIAATAVMTSNAEAIQPDPIFAAIEAHKAAHKLVESAVDTFAVLEREVQAKGGRFSTEMDEDPRVAVCEEAVDQAWDVETDAAAELVTIRPTSAAGMLALLKYAIEADTDGMGWPSELQSDDGELERSWQYFLIKNLGDVLPEILAAV